MRVLGVLGYYPPSRRVGAFLATHRFLAHLAARGHDVTVVTGAVTAGCEVLDGVTIRRLDPADAHALAGAADVVVSHFGDDLRASRSALAFGRPMVRMVHAFPAGGSFGPRPALAVFVSEAQRQAFDEIPCGSIVAYPPTDPAEHRASPGDRITLVNLADAKGGGLFMRLAREMHDRQFLGVKGGYGDQNNPESSNVEVIATTQNMRDDVWSRTRVLLMPSACETWGMTGVEAMCSGIPVIAHPTPGLKESLGSAGIFVDRNDPRGWVDAIRRLDDPEVYAAASARALARVDELLPEIQAGLDRFADAVEALCP